MAGKSTLQVEEEADGAKQCWGWRLQTWDREALALDPTHMEKTVISSFIETGTIAVVC